VFNRPWFKAPWDYKVHAIPMVACQAGQKRSISSFDSGAIEACSACLHAKGCWHIPAWAVETSGFGYEAEIFETSTAGPRVAHERPFQKG
jgi:hypothetical protein